MISNQQQLSAGAGELTPRRRPLGSPGARDIHPLMRNSSKFSSSAVGMPFSPLVSEIT